MNKTFKKIITIAILSLATVGITASTNVVKPDHAQIVYAAKRRYQKVTVNFNDQMHMDGKYTRSCVKEAIHEWNEASRTNFVYTKSKHADITIYTYRFPAKNRELGATEPKEHGHVNIFIDPYYAEEQDDYLDNVIAHELGHAMGLGHSSEKKSIMHFDDYYNDIQEITKRDARMANKYYPRFWSKSYNYR